MRSRIGVASLFPREHGAYAQLGVSIATAFGVAGLSAGGLLFTVAVAAGFLAHEPAAILLGQRGGRARRSRSAAARTWLAICVTVLLVAAAGALAAIEPGGRWSIVAPLVFAMLLAVATVRGRDKSVEGEIAGGLAFSAATLPVCVAGGASPAVAVTVAVPLALLFTVSTLAVRITILKVRSGGHTRAADATRRITFLLAAGAVVALSVAIARDQLSPCVLAATAPGLLTAVIVAAHPPSPARLRTLGWALVGVSVFTAAIIVASAGWTSVR